jgi:hypothetical protein
VRADRRYRGTSRRVSFDLPHFSGDLRGLCGFTLLLLAVADEFRRLSILLLSVYFRLGELSVLRSLHPVPVGDGRRRRQVTASAGAGAERTEVGRNNRVFDSHARRVA